MSSWLGVILKTLNCCQQIYHYSLTATVNIHAHEDTPCQLELSNQCEKLIFPGYEKLFLIIIVYCNCKTHIPFNFILFVINNSEVCSSIIKPDLEKNFRNSRLICNYSANQILDKKIYINLVKF